MDRLFAYYGIIFTVLGLAMVIGQGVIVGPFTKRYGDLKLIKAGFLLSGVSLAGVMLANSYALLLLAIAFFGLCSAVLIPAITSLTSKRTAMSQGLTMGLNNSFISLGRIFGPLVGGFVFDFHWGLPFLSGALVMLAGFMASLHSHLQALQPTPLPSPPREQ